MTDTREATPRPWAGSDYPDRVGIAKPSSSCVVGFNTPSLDYSEEYIRADIAKVPVDALEKIRDAGLKGYLTPDLCAEIVMGALSKLEASHGSA